MQTVQVNEKEYRLKQTKVIRREEEFGHSYWTKEYGWLVGVTTMLSIAVPPPVGLIQYWKNTEATESEERLTLAGEAGTRVHSALEVLLLGEAVPSKSLITTKEKKAVAAFIDWFRAWQPKESVSEQVVAYLDVDAEKGKDYRFAGTLDLLCKIGDEWAVIDFKTGRSDPIKHGLQIAAYAGCIEQSLGIKVTKKYCLYLGTGHKIAGRRTNDMGLPTTGPGWSVEESKYAFSDFLKTYDYGLFINGGYPEPPTVVAFPETFQLLTEVAPKVKPEPTVEPVNETPAEYDVSQASEEMAERTNKAADKAVLEGLKK